MEDRNINVSIDIILGTKMSKLLMFFLKVETVKINKIKGFG
jgi:hypothetical protein